MLSPRLVWSGPTCAGYFHILSYFPVLQGCEVLLLWAQKVAFQLILTQVTPLQLQQQQHPGFSVNCLSSCFFNLPQLPHPLL